MDSKNRSERVSYEFGIFDSLRKIIKAVDIYSAKLKELFGINSSQLSCLLALEPEPISLSTLSQKVSLSPSMITNIIDQLEKIDLVERKRSTSDRRIILIELTKKGKETTKNAPLSFQKRLLDGLTKLSTDRVKNINEAMNELLSIIVSEILFDSSILLDSDKLAGVNPSVIESEIDIKNKDINK